MSAKRIITILAAAIILVTMGSCGKINEIEVTSFKLDSITPKNSRTVVVDFSLGVHNPIMAFTVSGLKGTVYYDGVALGNYAASPVKISGKTDRVYKMSGLGSLSEGMSFLQLMKMGMNFDTSKVTLDIDVELRVGMVKKKFKFRQKPLDEFM